MGMGIHCRGGPEQAEMRRWALALTLAALTLAGIWGSVIGVVELRQAIFQSQEFYRLDTAGSQIESDLEFQAQENRRAVLSALAVADAHQLPSVDAAREADERVRG